MLQKCVYWFIPFTTKYLLRARYWTRLLSDKKTSSNTSSQEIYIYRLNTRRQVVDAVEQGQVDKSQGHLLERVPFLAADDTNTTERAWRFFL